MHIIHFFLSLFFLLSPLLYTEKNFKGIPYNNIAIIAIQHSKINFGDTFADFSHIV